MVALSYSLWVEGYGRNDFIAWAGLTWHLEKFGGCLSNHWADTLDCLFKAVWRVASFASAWIRGFVSKSFSIAENVAFIHV
ncbi:hypothetical protein HMPREF2617_04855 [Corynebacterium sp. HMSC070H05]|nr:hypothetical protein HMPREF2617_04855 [Corynebacterium sp. HMSC070H05]